jgi:hypothetical protein
MSSLRRIQSSKANGALSKGPSTPAGKLTSSLNAIRHGLCAKCIVVEGESRENFLILLQQHVDRFQPADEVEFGMIEEMCASYWRQRRAWSLETSLFNKQMALQPDGVTMERMAVALETFAASPSLSLLHRYETRLHLTYQRALRTLILLRTIDPNRDTNPNQDMAPSQDIPNDPNPTSEHSPPAEEPPPPAQQAADSEPLGSASFSLHQSSSAAPAARDVPAGQVLAKPSAAHPATPQRGKKLGGAA